MGANCSSHGETINPQQMICIKEKNGIYKIIIFNCETEEFEFQELNSDLFKLEKLSQISFENMLYLVGAEKKTIQLNSNIDIDKSQLSHCDSINYKEVLVPIFISIDTKNIPLEITYEEPTLFQHQNPSVCINKLSDDNFLLFAVGGVNCKKCEYFDSEKNKWVQFDDLPSERFGCSITYINSEKILLICGGINDSNDIEQFFEVNTNTPLMSYSFDKKEYQNIPSNIDVNITKYFSHLFYEENDKSLFIFGGMDTNNNVYDQIESSKGNGLQNIEVCNYKLANKSTFKNIFSISYINNIIFLFDEEKPHVHKIEYLKESAQIVNYEYE